MTAPSDAEIDVGQLGPLRKIGAGGQGTVYALDNGPETLVYKEYSPRVVDDVDVAALRRFVAFGRDLDEPTRKWLTERAAWPINLVRRDGVVRGFVMPRAPREFSIELTWTTGRDSVLAAVQYLLNDRRYLAERGLDITDMFRLEFLRDTVETIARFHELGIVVGDLSPNNVLFSQLVRPRCFFLDCDAMRLDSDSVLAAVETPDWRVEDVGDEQLNTPESDAYKVALLAVRIFAGDQHETDPKAVPTLPPATRTVTINSLDHSPDARPAVDMWLRPLDTALTRARRRRRVTIRVRRPRRRPRRAPRPAPAAGPPRRTPRPVTRQRRVRAWAFGAIPVAVAILVGIISGINGGGNSPTAGGNVDVAQLPLLTPALAVPSYDFHFTPNVLLPTGLPLYEPALPTFLPLLCENAVAADVPQSSRLNAARSAIGSYTCALPGGDATDDVVPTDTRSRGNFRVLAALAPGGVFDATITSLRQESSSTLRVQTNIAVHTSGGGTIGCRDTTFVLQRAGGGDYVISSVGPPVTARCA